MALAILGFGVWFKTLGYDMWILFNVFGAFAFGALIAALLEDGVRVERRRSAFSAFFAISGVLGFAYVRWYYTVPVSDWQRSWMVWRDSLQNFAFYAIHFGIVGFVATNAGRWFLAPLRMRELTYLGEISYGMYLYHLPIYWLVGGYWIQQNEPWTMWVAKIALTFVAASLSYRYLERSILSLKERFPYEPRPESVPAVPRPKMRDARPRPVGSDRASAGR